MNPLENLMDQWLSPAAEFRGAPFWSWNAQLDPDRLCRDVQAMHEAGMGGFFMHSRYGLKTPYLSEQWFKCVSACVAKARELGMKAYLYDEDRWPSGSAGGLVTREHPEYGMHLIQACRPGRQMDDSEPLATFAITRDAEGRLVSYKPAGPADMKAQADLLQFSVGAYKPSGWHNDGTYVDTMNGEAIDEFISVTHQAYADRFGRDFGGLIPAIFTDEPNYFHPFSDGVGGVDRLLVAPWTADLPRQFIERRGYDLRDHMPEIFLPPAEGGFSKVRCDYYRTLTELFVENFTARIAAWCDTHGIALTGHVLSEGSLTGQTGVVGACMPHYRHMQWPGIDMLCDQADELLTAKQCSSVAAQLGKPRVLSELYGCTGWDWPLSGHKFIGDWQLAAGVNLRCPHLTHYSLTGGGKRDYPASIFTHSPWWKYYRHVEDYFARLCFMLTRGKPVRDVLVIHPIESAWGLYVPGASKQCDELLALEEGLRMVIYGLSGQHWDYDLADESILAEHGKAAGGSISVGQMTYKAVVVPPCLTLRATTVDLLGRFVAGGGKCIFAGVAPELVDGRKSPRIAKLAAKGQACPLDAERIAEALASATPCRVSVTAEDGRQADFVWHMLRAVPDGRLLFLQSHDRTSARKVRVRTTSQGNVTLWDAATGRLRQVQAEAEESGTSFELCLDPAGSALLSIGPKVPGAAAPALEPAVVESRAIDGPWRISLAEPNTFPLDYCRLSVGQDEFSQPMPTLRADGIIRKRFGLSDRVGYQQQPWYLYATGNVDTSPRGRCRLRWEFNVEGLPPTCALAMERPGDFQVTVNGRAAGKGTAWWVDQDIVTIDIARLLKQGGNEVMLTFDYRPDMELEDLYLVGDFGVRQTSQPGQPRLPGGAAIVAKPESLNAGSWVGQGLDFYGGAVTYRLTVNKPAGRRVRLSLPQAACTAAAIHAGEKTFFLPWPPFAAEITDALADGDNEVAVEVIGGRKNILGPLHTPWARWTGPKQFDPTNTEWRDEYLLNDHGLLAPPVVEILEQADPPAACRGTRLS